MKTCIVLVTVIFVHGACHGGAVKPLSPARGVSHHLTPSAAPVREGQPPSVSPLGSPSDEFQPNGNGNIQLAAEDKPAGAYSLEKQRRASDRSHGYGDGRKHVLLRRSPLDNCCGSETRPRRISEVGPQTNSPSPVFLNRTNAIDKPPKRFVRFYSEVITSKPTARGASENGAYSAPAVRETGPLSVLLPGSPSDKLQPGVNTIASRGESSAPPHLLSKRSTPDGRNFREMKASKRVVRHVYPIKNPPGSTFMTRNNAADKPTEPSRVVQSFPFLSARKPS